jgi:CYTH domain-containing protein
MATETERKFLLKGDFRKYIERNSSIRQGYLSSVPGRTVRIRLSDDNGYLTVKGASSANGLSRYEWEKSISPDDARMLLSLCEPGIIEKTRHYISHGDHVIVVDEFMGENEGLILAEVELENESEPFEKPDWLGDEVTGDHRYYNSFLKDHPWPGWK